MPKGLKGFQKGHKIRVGTRHTEESKRKMSEASKSRKRLPHSAETRKRISKALKGRKFSEEHRKKLSQKAKGKKRTEESKRKMSKSHKGKKFSEEHKRKIGQASRRTALSAEYRKRLSLSRRGEKSYLWKGGITPLYFQIRNSFAYRQWRSDVFTRDDFTCQECNDSKGGNLEAHHIEELNQIIEKYQIKTLHQALECEELWNINNGITLCKDCHKILHKKCDKR